MADDLTAEEYQRALALLKDPSAKLSDEERTLLIGVRDQFENAHAQAQAPQAQAEAPINPSMSLVWNGLNAQPATTHEAGDQGAAEEWIRNPEKASQGAVFMYEPPLAVAKKEMLENPGILQVIFPDDYTLFDPERIAQLTTDSDEYKKFADYKWREAADEAAKSGRTAYRYSRAPYLQGEAQGLDTLGTLGLKARGTLPIAGSNMTRFVLGVDKAATLGVSGRGAFATAPDPGSRFANPEGNPGIPGSTDLTPNPNARDYVEERRQGPARDDYAGIEDPTKQGYDQFMSEGHLASGLGQGIGTLAPWAAANRAFAVASGAARPIAGLGLSAGRNVAAATAGGAGGAALEQAGREGVDAAVHMSQGGPAPDAAGVAGRIGVSSVLGGVTGGVLDFFGGSGADYIRHESPRYGGNVGEFETAGGKMDLGLGPRAPRQAQEAVLEARGKLAEPVDIQAQRLAPKVEKSVEENLTKQREIVETKNAPFYASNEGQMRLPATNTLKKQVQLLDENHSAEKGFLEPIPNKKDQVTYLRNQLNDTVSDVSATPVPDAVELTPRQAEAFLSESRKRALKEQLEGPKGPTTGAREIDLEAGGGGGDDVSFEELLKRKGVDKVYLVPKRFTAKEHEQLIRGYQQLTDPADPNARERKELYEAGFEDRKARPMNGQPGAWAAQQKENSLALEAAEEEARHALRGGSAFKPLVDYSRRHRGQIELADAVRSAAGRAGSKEELEQLRVLGLLDNLNRLSSPLGGNVGGIQRSALGPNAAFDSTTLRLGYPLLKLLEGPLGGLRGGLGGAVGPAVVDNQEREKP